MTAFIAICAAMIAAALVLVARPLLKSGVSLLALALTLPAITGALYWKFGHHTWEQDAAQAHAQTDAQRELGAKIADLERRSREAPNDVALTLELAEALIGQDERALYGRAGQLLEQALQVAPTHPKALWYGAIHALAQQQLPLARDRLRTMLSQNPPADIRGIIERQIQDIEQQMAQAVSPSTPSAASGRVLHVQVTLADALAKQVSPDTPLFVLARDPSGAGPPLAVVRRAVRDLPLSISLSDSDAMMAGRGIGQASRVQVIARIAKGGTPQSQPGDLYGDALVELTGNAAHSVRIAIQHTVTQ